MEKRRVVITGMGALTPIGGTAETSWAAARAGVCGIDTIRQFDTSGLKVHLAGEVKDFRVEDHVERREARRMDRFTQFAMVAAAEAMADSGLDMAREDAARCGVMVSSGIGGMNTIQSECHKGFEKGFDHISPFFIPMIHPQHGRRTDRHQVRPSGYVHLPRVRLRRGRPNAVGDSFRHIRDGYAEVMVCGGAESTIAGMGMGGFTSLRAVTPATDPSRASIPFDLERSGFVMGEGAGILVLEEYDHARARGAEILGRSWAIGANCDAHHITAPCPDGAGAAACMTLALHDAGIAPEEVDYISAHGTSTPLNDSGETQAVKTAFGPHAYHLMMSATKSMTGHLLGASGAVASIFTLLALRDQFAPPTINYQVPDPACDLDLVPNEGRAAVIRHAMVNAFGFGGHNASLIFRHWEE